MTQPLHEKLYCFKYANKVEYLTIQQARALNLPELNYRISEIILNSKSKRMNKDGFEGGFQANINEVIYNRSDYDRRLRELNLIEIGYEAVPKDTTTTTDHCSTLEFALAAREAGVELTDNEVDAIASGEYLKNAECDLSGE